MRAPLACPKCQRERRPGEAACARCGLEVDRWDGFAAAPPAHEALDAAWAALLTSWEDNDAHRRFLEAAAHMDALDIAAARYQERRREYPSDARADTGLRRAASLAENLQAARAQAERLRVPGAWLRIVGQLFAAVIVLGLVWALLFVFTRAR
jgi:hypothetical protein